MAHFSTIPELQDLVADLCKFEQKLTQFGEHLGLALTQYLADHVEFVLSVLPEQLIHEAYKLLPAPLPAVFRTKESHPQGSNESLPNPTLAVTNGEITIKFHPFSLKDIIKN
ncbi:VOC family protein [Xenorhabdus thuongxuanensis]|uniref:Metal-binding protein n=1 Tax=Xenorhabdus thuongxuanensis TaxID=1873484 RepID=A0A1Q5TZ53_9GAMM|nr:VOC family protein [Xenorhabdus thuongxuanensis]OKP05495.1 metal-binding protein [Xenorhabdus thuongxuanensis]